ncbi:PilZ domain-containing protein [Sphingomonas sp. AP4-R1]|uniref:PilZ domain-containing protein n=1 Tax=Sphingomonas sp. AP4-R1 TaxID=2735134 RepID=UPI0014937815|nr:PilZ domain-containing protein [Sphingomonas sp. AP4-R1]QJU57934.1 PilZ domain-containing protein [Sphingomonas sp. AP4-R1]
MVFITPTGERLAQDRRRTRRWPTHATCGVRGPDGVPSSVTLWNISEGGFGAQCAAAVAGGDRLTFRLGRTGYADARVVWRIGDVVGCEFLRPVSPAEVALALATATPVAIDDKDEPRR